MRRDGIRRIQELMEVTNSDILSESLSNELIPKNICIDIIQFLMDNENNVFIQLFDNIENENNLDFVDDDDYDSLLTMLANGSKLFGKKYNDLGYLDYFVAFLEKNLFLIKQNIFEENLYVSPTLRKYEINVTESYTARHETERRIYEKYYSGPYLINSGFLYMEYNEGNFDPYEGDVIDDDWEMIDSDGWELDGIEEVKNQSTNEMVLKGKKTLLEEISRTNDIQTLLELQNTVKHRLMKFGL
jgi:hypothetical protein